MNEDERENANILIMDYEDFRKEMKQRASSGLLTEDNPLMFIALQLWYIRKSLDFIIEEMPSKEPK